MIAVASLSASAGSHRLALPVERLAELRRRFGDAEDWFREFFGHGYEGLTHAKPGSSPATDRLTDFDDSPSFAERRTTW